MAGNAVTTKDGSLRNTPMSRSTAGKVATFVATTVLLAGCANISHVKRLPDQASQVVGPSVTENTTPLENSFACVGERITASGEPPLSIAVGNVRDYTGKFSEADGGNSITQGGSLMVISALGKLNGAVRIFERFDTQVADLELAYLSKRYLGDGLEHRITDKGRTRVVPWKPYMGGTILESDYFIVGGITELNYNIQTGGAELEIDQMGPKGRIYTVNVAADLRIVNTRTLEIVRTSTLQKQVVGYEVGFEIFEFFSDTLVDLNIGKKSQEPMQLAVRATLEQGVIELIGHVSGIDPVTCINFQKEDLRLAKNGEEWDDSEKEMQSGPAEDIRAEELDGSDTLAEGDDVMEIGAPTADQASAQSDDDWYNEVAFGGEEPEPVVAEPAEVSIVNPINGTLRFSESVPVTGFEHHGPAKAKEMAKAKQIAKAKKQAEAEADLLAMWAEAEGGDALKVDAAGSEKAAAQDEVEALDPVAEMQAEDEAGPQADATMDDEDEIERQAAKPDADTQEEANAAALKGQLLSAAPADAGAHKG
ncbi:MAG: CsgG/HfaB family protein [Alphaproteobacteria bacterium]